MFNKRARLLEGILIPVLLSDIHEARNVDRDALERLYNHLQEYRKLTGREYPNSHLFPMSYISYEEERNGN